MYKVEIDRVPEKLSNVRDAILDHGRPLQTESKPVDSHILRHCSTLSAGPPNSGELRKRSRTSSGPEELGPEHAAVADFDELVEPLMMAENFHARFRVWIITVTAR